jgi:hypothetical protein
MQNRFLKYIIYTCFAVIGGVTIIHSLGATTLIGIILTWLLVLMFDSIVYIIVTLIYNQLKG